MAVRNIQGLRALAAMMVVLAHVGGTSGVHATLFGGGPRWVDLEEVGRTGVDLFFVISGFIMLVTTARIRHGVEGARHFLWRRVTRIYPPYLVVTAAVLAVYLVRPELVNDSQQERPDVLASLLLLPQDGLPLLLVGWTLVFEMYFYVVLGLTLLLPRRALVPALAAWALVTVVVGQVESSHPYVELVASPMNIEFLLGAVIGGLFAAGHRHAPQLSTLVGAGTAVALAVAVMLGGDPYPGRGDWALVLVTAVPFTLLVYGLACLEADGGWVVPAPLVGLGDASYSLYLTHVGVFKVMTVGLAALALEGVVAQVVVVPAAVAGAVVAALVFYVLVEKRLLRLQPGRRARGGGTHRAHGAHRAPQGDSASSPSPSGSTPRAASSSLTTRNATPLE